MKSIHIVEDLALPDLIIEVINIHLLGDGVTGEQIFIVHYSEVIYKSGVPQRGCDIFFLASGSIHLHNLVMRGAGIDETVVISNRSYIFLINDSDHSAVVSRFLRYRIELEYLSSWIGSCIDIPFRVYI